MIATALTWLLNSPVGRLTLVIALVIVSDVAAYKVGYWRGDHARAEAIQAAQAVKSVKALEADAEARTKQALETARIADASKDLNAYVDAHPGRGDECLSGTDVDRVRRLWGPSAPAK